MQWYIVVKAVPLIYLIFETKFVYFVFKLVVKADFFPLQFCHLAISKGLIFCLQL